MSIHAMNLVWQNYPRGGSEKLALLALADWCDDDGGNLYPSIRTVARKICASESQARRIIHGFIDEGLLEVVGNFYGGNKTQTRRYRINLDQLALTPVVRATPRTSATPCMDARYPLHGCALPLAPVQANTSLTIKEPPRQKEAIEVLDYLNTKTARAYRPVTSNLQLITARLKEGATVEECKAVIDAKATAWLPDPKMKQFVRPATLFGATNFAQYVGEIEQDPSTGGEQWE